MERMSEEVLEALKEFDSATLFNAVVENLGGTQGGLELRVKGGQPENYTGPEIRCLLPELGSAMGYVVTAEVTTNDPDSVAIPWDEYYQVLDQTTGPVVAVIEDVDSRPGRGASFGDGMAALHKALGVTGVVVDGSVRDLNGIKDLLETVDTEFVGHIEQAFFGHVARGHLGPNVALKEVGHAGVDLE